MPRKSPTIRRTRSDLRTRAESRLRAGTSAKPDPAFPANAVRLLHELQVHQVELEMQNTELLQARARSESLLEQYTDLYDFAPIGYFTLDAASRIQLVNLTGARTLATDRARLVDRPFSAFVSPRNRLLFTSFLDRVFAGESVPPCEISTAGPAPALRRLSIEAVRSADAKECRVAVTDVTAHHLSEERVRLSEIRYRRLFEAAHDGVLLMNPETRRITDANPFMSGLLGYTKEELCGKELFEIGLIKDRFASQEMFIRLKRLRKVRYDNLPLETRDGRHRLVEVVANLYEENGHPVIQCNIRDITVRKEAEQVLQRNEALFSSLVEQAPMGVYVIDAEFRLQQVNRKARPVFASVRPLIGRDFAEIHHLLWPRAISDRNLRQFRQTLATGVTYKSASFYERRRDTGVKEAYEWQVQRITLPGGEFGVVVFFHDLTERIQAEETRRRVALLSADYRKANREIARRRMAEASLIKSERSQRALLVESRALHAQLRQLTRKIISVQEDERKAISRALHDEVMQILVSIDVELAILGRAAPHAGPDVKATIARSHQVVESAIKAVHQFARDLRPSVLDDFGLIPALRAHIKLLEQRHGLKITLRTFRGAERLEGDRLTVLFRIAQEALANVGRHAGASAVRVTLLRQRGGIRLQVSDNGKSFPVAKVTSARNPKRLGLVGMKERAEMVGGSLTIRSIAGRGTTVTATIPFVEPDPS